MADKVKIKGYENYTINKLGEVFNTKTNKSLKSTKAKNGYYVIGLYNEKGCKTLYIHRLLCEAFIEQKEGFNFVNHKNGIKEDNRIENLEWCTHSMNTQHSWDNGLSDNVRKSNILRQSRIVIDTQTGIFYESAKEAAKLLGLNANTLRCYLNNCYPNKTNLKYA